MSIDVLAAFLKTVGAFQTRHSGRTLGHHLLGTYALLKDAGCDEETCLAGGLHSIYGTPRFRRATLDKDPFSQDVARITRLFGDRVEILVCQFSDATTLDIEDVVTRDPNDGDFIALALITAANLIEQNGEEALDRWPRIKAIWLSQRELADHGVPVS